MDDGPFRSATDEEVSDERVTSPGTEDRSERVTSSSCRLRSLEVTLLSESANRKTSWGSQGMGKLPATKDASQKESEDAHL